MILNALKIEFKHNYSFNERKNEINWEKGNKIKIDWHILENIRRDNWQNASSLKSNKLCIHLDKQKWNL